MTSRRFATMLCGTFALAGASLGFAGSMNAQGGSGGKGNLVEVTVIIENLAPMNGSALTPTWVGFHDGSFDIYDLGAPASMGLERIAEDGNSMPLDTMFQMSGAGSTSATIVSDMGIPPILPGETATMTFMLDGRNAANRYLSYAAMVLPSNDAFIANGDPQEHRIFNPGGRFMGADFIIAGYEVTDAGTELNDEDPVNTAFFGQATPDTGQDEAVGVHPHVGFKFPGAGGILDDPGFANGDFLAPGYQIARVRVLAEGQGGGDDDDDEQDDDDDQS